MRWKPPATDDTDELMAESAKLRASREHNPIDDFVYEDLRREAEMLGLDNDNEVVRSTDELARSREIVLTESTDSLAGFNPRQSLGDGTPDVIHKMVQSFRMSKSVEGGTWASKLRVQVPGGLADSLDISDSEDSYSASLVQADLRALGPQARDVRTMLAGRRSMEYEDDVCGGDGTAYGKREEELWTGEAGQEALEAANAVMMETRKTIELTMKGVHERLCSEMHVTEEELKVEEVQEPCEEAAAAEKLACMEEASMISIAENLAMQMEGLGIQRKYAEMQALDAEDLAKKQKAAKKKAVDDAAKDVHKVLGRLEEAHAKADSGTTNPAIGIMEGAQGSNLDSAAPIGLGLMMAFQGKDLSSSVSAGLDELTKLQQATRARMQHLEGMGGSCGTCMGVCNCGSRGQDFVCPPGYEGPSSAGMHEETGGGRYRVAGRTDAAMPLGQLVNGGGGGPASAMGGGGSILGGGGECIPASSAHSVMTRATDEIQNQLDSTMMNFKRHLDVDQKDAQEKKDLEKAKEKAKKKAEESAKNDDKDALDNVEAEWADAQAKGKVPFPKLFEPAEWRAFRNCADAAPTVADEMGRETGAGSMADEASVRFDAATRVLHGCAPSAAPMVGGGSAGEGQSRGDPRGDYLLPPHCQPYATDPHYPNRANSGGEVPGWVAGQAGEDWGVGLGDGWEAGQAAIRGALARDPLAQHERQPHHRYHPHPHHPSHHHYHNQQQRLQQHEQARAAEAAAGRALAPPFPPSCLPEHGSRGMRGGDRSHHMSRYADEPEVAPMPGGGVYDYMEEGGVYTEEGGVYSAHLHSAHRAGVRSRAAAEREAAAEQHPFGRGMPSTTAATPPKRRINTTADRGESRVQRNWSPRARQAHAHARARAGDLHRDHLHRDPNRDPYRDPNRDATREQHEQRRWQQRQARADELLGFDDDYTDGVEYGQEPIRMARGGQGAGAADRGGVGVGVGGEQLEQQGRAYLSTLMEQWQQHHRMSPVVAAPQPQMAEAAPIHMQAEQQLQQLQQQLQQQQILQSQLLQFQQQMSTTRPDVPASASAMEPKQPAFLQPPQPHPSDHYSLVWGANHNPSSAPPPQQPPQQPPQPQVQVRPQAGYRSSGSGGGRYAEMPPQQQYHQQRAPQQQQGSAAQLRNNLDHFKELRMQRMKGLEATAY
jgi:hypothetical protein